MARRGGKRQTVFDESLRDNSNSYMLYVDRLAELSMSMFDWKNLPDEIDQRFLEMVLFSDGKAIFFKDEPLGYLALQFSQQGRPDVYRNPITRRAFAVNGYNRVLSNKDSVIIWNNYLRTNTENAIRVFAKRMWELDRIVEVNAKAQKTPVLVQGSEQQRLTLLNLYKEFDGNAPVIFGDKNLDVNGLKSIKTDAPYVADKIYELKTKIWNEALTYLGISNLNVQKKERLVADEVVRSMGGTIASRYSRLQARREAVENINRMFGLDIEVDYREDYREADDEVMFSGETGDGSQTDMATDIRTR